MQFSKLTNSELARRWKEVENTLAANVAQAYELKTAIIDTLAERDPVASHAFLCALMRGESPQMKDYFKLDASAAEEPKNGVGRPKSGEGK